MTFWGLLSLVFLVLLPIGLLWFFIYSTRLEIISLREWGFALLSGLVWGLAGLLGAILVGEAWTDLFDDISDGYALYDLIHYELGVYTYYSLALAGILAGVLGCTTLYLLLRRTQSRAEK